MDELGLNAERLALGDVPGFRLAETGENPGPLPCEGSDLPLILALDGGQARHPRTGGATAMSTNPIAPEDAVEQYIQSRADVLPSTLDNHRYRLRCFLEWAEQAGLDVMSELEPLDLERYKNYRLDETECNLVTLDQHLHTFRVFLRWCEDTDTVEQELSDKVIIPNVSSKDRARDEAISHERAQEIIDFLADFHWASRLHITFHILYHCGLRRSGAYSLDVDDWRSDERFLAVRNRPDEGTRLKLGDDGERNVTVTDGRLASALDSWIEKRRPDVVDEHGRKPLLASEHGRLHYQTITKQVYKVTRPCFYGDGCPIGREPEECEGTDPHKHSKCPESVSAHPIRRSSITHHLSEDVPKEIVSERCSVSTDVLDTHYDARSIEQRRQNRERYLEDV